MKLKRKTTDSVKYWRPKQMEVALPLEKEICFRVIPDRANL